MGFNNDGAEVGRRAARGARRRRRGAGPCSASTSARPRSCPTTTRPRSRPTTRRAPACSRRTPTTWSSTSARPTRPGLRNLQAVEKLAAAARARPAYGGRCVDRPPGPAAGQDRPRPGRRRRARGRRPGARASASTASSPPTRRSPAPACAARPPRSRRSAPAGCPARRSPTRSLEVLRLLRGRVGPDLTLIGVGGITTVEDARARLDAGADPAPGLHRVRLRGPAVAAPDRPGRPADDPARCTSPGRCSTASGSAPTATSRLVAPGVPERFRPGTFVAVTARPTPPASPAASLLDPPGPRRSAATAPPSSWSSSRPASAARVAGRRCQSGATARRSPGRSAGRSRCPRSRSAACWSARAASAAPLFPLAERLRERGCAVTLRRRRPRRGPPALRARGPPLGPRGHRRHRRRLRRAARPGRRRGRRGAGPLRGRGRLRRRPATTPSTPSPPPPRRTAPGARPPSRCPTPCATGLCHGCPLPVVGEDGVARVVRACSRRSGPPR